ncbi:MAG: hypothetical protein PVG66_07525 [Chromatiales bacterium]|jgi:8-oxo-dGTP pyrophosphatase MutT (NUDIX family)
MPQRRVAVIPVIKHNKRSKIYLVTCRENCKWIIPTGKHEKRLSDKKVAALEAYEEAGVIGKLDKSFRKSLLVQSPGGKKKRRLKLYLIKVEKSYKKWPEDKQRKRKRVAADELGKYVSDKRLRKQLKRQMAKFG